MTKKELQAELDSRDIEYPADATNEKLEALLDNAKDDYSDEEEIVEDNQDDEGKPEDDSVDEEIVDEEEIVEKVVEKKVDEDYLRQYQYKKVNDVPTVGGKLTDPDKGSKAEIMKKALLKQPKVRILIQKKHGDTGAVPLSVNLNGYRLDLPKNTYIELPDQIATLIMNSQQQRNEAIEEMRIDGEDKKETALL